MNEKIQILHKEVSYEDAHGSQAKQEGVSHDEITLFKEISLLNNGKYDKFLIVNSEYGEIKHPISDGDYYFFRSNSINITSLLIFTKVKYGSVTRGNTSSYMATITKKFTLNIKVETKSF